MSRKSGLIVVQAPQCRAKPDQAARQARKSAEKREAEIRSHVRRNSRVNRHPGMNKFFDVITTAPSIPVKKVKEIINAEGNKATIEVATQMNFAGKIYGLSPEAARQRREANKARRIRHLYFRRRKPHGRN